MREPSSTCSFGNVFWLRVLVVVATVSLASCGTIELQPAANATNDPSFEAIVDEPEDQSLVGLAISGGGSRAAIFAAAVMAQLAQIAVECRNGHAVSVLDQIQFISSVSGGSVAAAYFAINSAQRPLRADVPCGVSTIPGGPDTSDGRFFGAFQHAMASDFEGAAAVNGLAWFDVLDMGAQFARVWDDSFLHGKTFADLYADERVHRTPQLILNGTRYETGRRFVMTTIPTQAFEINITDLLKREVIKNTNAVSDAAVERAVGQANDTLEVESFDSVGAKYDTLRLSEAVATSAAFPGLVGPLTYHVKGKETFIHIGDGGVSDNLGLESLAQLFLKKLESDARRQQNALIIVIDASFPFDVENQNIAHAQNRTDVRRVSLTREEDIQENRAAAYRSVLWELATVNGGNSAVNRLHVVHLRHTDLTRGTWPSECPEPHPQPDMARAVEQIATNFSLDTCEQSLLIDAAVASVETHERQIRCFYDGKSAAECKKN